MMRHFTQVPERGDFAYQCLVAPQQVSGAKLLDTRDHFGLKFTKHMPFGCVAAEDGSQFGMVRALNDPQSTPNPTKFIYVSSLIDGQNLRIDKDKIVPRALTMFPKRYMDGDKACWSNLDGEEGAPWKITASGSEFSWVEEGLFDLKGRILGRGFQWYLPGLDWGTFYVSQLYDVAGTCEGRKVKGMIALDQAWMAEGGAIHFQKDLVVNNKMHVIWWTFANVYTDGTWETGSFLVGHENLGYFIHENHKGEIRVSTDIEGQVKHKDGSWFVETASVVVDGKETWEFIPDTKGDMTDFVGGFPITAQQQGRWQRVGETRTADHWLGWGESDRRNGTSRNVRGTEL